MTRPASSPLPARRRDLRSDAGFGLIEVAVAMIIIAILMAVSVPMYLTARKSARHRDAAAAAATYAKAVEQFRLTRAGRLPVIGSADWPTVNRGPVDPQGRPYVKDVPGPVESGTVSINTQGQHGAITYTTDAAGRYHFLVTMRSGYTCVQGNLPHASAPDC